MNHIQTSVYHVTGGTEEVQQRAHADLLPILQRQAGFIEYDLIQAEERVTSTSTWQTRRQAEEAGRQSAGWVRENFSALAVQLEDDSVAAVGPAAARSTANVPG